MIDTLALRCLTIKCALRGKLTTPEAGDDSVTDIISSISPKKAIVQANNIPYEIPSHWRWVKLSDLYTINPRVDADNDTMAAFIPMEKISPGFDRTFTYAEQPWEKASKNHTKFADGDVAFAKISPCFENRKSFIAEGLPNAVGGGTTELIILRQKAMLPLFTYYVICDQRFINAGSKSYKGIVGQQRVKPNIIKNYLVPVPPLAEQKRIVARVEEIFRILDTIDAAQEKYAADAESLKAKLITAGIQGKLTEQLESDGTAEELYQQIQAEKQRLIKEGKIKKEKPLSEIKPEEVPFEIPRNWKWVRLNEICKSVMDGDHQPPPQTTEGMPFIVISNLSNGALDFSNTRHVSKEYFDSLSNERIAEQGDILFTVTGSFGIPIKVETDQQFCFQRHIALLKQLDCINTNYLLHVLKSEFVYKQCDDVALGVAQRTVGIKPLRNFLIPLPPLAEQKRIANKLDEVLSVLL